MSQYPPPPGESPTDLEMSAQSMQAPGDAALFESLYSELKQRAKAMRKAFRSHTLNTTAIVHEAFLKLAESRYQSIDRAHLLRTAALAMRQVLLDHARAWQTQKRGEGKPTQIALSEITLTGDAAPEQLLIVVDAMDRLAQVDARCHETFLLRTFAGLTLEEIGQLQGVSHMTCSRDFQTARAYLLSCLKD